MSAVSKPTMIETFAVKAGFSWPYLRLLFSALTRTLIFELKKYNDSDIPPSRPLGLLGGLTNWNGGSCPKGIAGTVAVAVPTPVSGLMETLVVTGKLFM